jgi:hypothetical protein
VESSLDSGTPESGCEETTRHRVKAGFRLQISDFGPSPLEFVLRVLGAVESSNGLGIRAILRFLPTPQTRLVQPLL